MDKDELLKFLLSGRKNTYVTGANKSKALLSESVQYEYSDGEWLYRDIYYIGNKKFAGLETVYFQNKPALSMSYYGNFFGVNEDEVDSVLRKALRQNFDSARLWQKVSWENDEYHYLCEGSGSIDEFDGSESITKNGKQIYYLYYAAGFLG